MRRKLIELEGQLAANRERREALAEKRSFIEQRLWQIAEQYRMGAISLLDYDRRISELLRDRPKEEMLAEIDQQLRQHEGEEEELRRQCEVLQQEMPKQQTIVGMQIAFAVLAIIALIGSILVLDHPQGMVVYTPPREEPAEPVQVEPVEDIPVWESTTQRQSQRAP